MTRLLIAPVVAVVLAFCAAILSVRVIPRDEALRAFFAAPDGCEMPCWAGIRPGTTRLDEALAILRAHPWVGHITMEGDVTTDEPSAVLWWHWNGRQPAFIDAETDGRMSADRDVVQLIVISTTVAMGDARVILGPPLQGNLERDAFEPSRAYHFALYGSFGVQNLLTCPIRVVDVWRQPVEIDLYADWRAVSSYEADSLTRWMSDPPC